MYRKDTTLPREVCHCVGRGMTYCSSENGCSDADWHCQKSGCKVALSYLLHFVKHSDFVVNYLLFLADNSDILTKINLPVIQISS